MGAVHRVAERVAVHFTGSRPLDSAVLTVAGTDFPLTLENTEVGVAHFTLPVVPLRTALTLTIAIGAQSAQAQVFFLQGEPGPPGLVVDVAADPGDCPLGGRELLMGTDGDGDGDLIGAEVRSSRIECDTLITSARVINISDGLSLQNALDDLDTVRIAPAGSVTLQLQAGTLTLPGQVSFSHVDGERILLTGPAAGATLAFPDSANGLVVAGGLRIANLTLTSPGPSRVAAGIAVIGSGFLIVDRGGVRVTVGGFGEGVSARGRGIVAADGAGLVVDGNGTGFVASGEGLLQVNGSTARNNNTGYAAEYGGIIIAEDSFSSGNASFGYIASLGGTIDAVRATSTDTAVGATGFAAAHNGFVRCTAGSSTAPTGLIVNDGGVGLCDGAAFTQGVRVQGTAHANLNAATGGGNAVVSANSTLVFPSGNGRCTPTSDSFCILTP